MKYLLVKSPAKWGGINSKEPILQVTTSGRAEYGAQFDFISYRIARWIFTWLGVPCTFEGGTCHSPLPPTTDALAYKGR